MHDQGTDRLLAAIGEPHPRPYAVKMRDGRTIIVRATTAQQAARAACVVERCTLGAIDTVKRHEPAVVKEWLEASDYRRVILSHGGHGGRFYVAKEDDGNVVGDGAGETIESALEEAFRNSH